MLLRLSRPLLSKVADCGFPSVLANVRLLCRSLRDRISVDDIESYTRRRYLTDWAEDDKNSVSSTETPTPGFHWVDKYRRRARIATAWTSGSCIQRQVLPPSMKHHVCATLLVDNYLIVSLCVKVETLSDDERQLVSPGDSCPLLLAVYDVPTGTCLARQVITDTEDPLNVLTGMQTCVNAQRRLVFVATDPSYARTLKCSAFTIPALHPAFRWALLETAVEEDESLPPWGMVSSGSRFAALIRDVPACWELPKDRSCAPLLRARAEPGWLPAGDWTIVGDTLTADWERDLLAWTRYSRVCDVVDVWSMTTGALLVSCDMGPSHRSIPSLLFDPPRARLLVVNHGTGGMASITLDATLSGTTSFDVVSDNVRGAQNKNADANTDDDREVAYSFFAAQDGRYAAVLTTSENSPSYECVVFDITLSRPKRLFAVTGAWDMGGSLQEGTQGLLTSTTGTLFIACTGHVFQFGH